MSPLNALLSPTFTTRFHATMTVIWLLLIVPTVLWWQNSITWVIVMSLWANIAAHAAAFQASRSEKATEKGRK